MFAAVLLATRLLTGGIIASVVPIPPVAIQPLGDVDPDVVSTLATQLEGLFGTTVTVLSPQPLPESAWYAPRRRWRADKIVDFLNRTTAPQVGHVIGVTSCDISVTKGEVEDWGVFGVAQLSGRPGLVSTYRLHANHASDTLFKTRLEHVAAHELCHALGLPHCSHAGCLMHDAEGSIKPVDESTSYLCADCLKRLAEALR